jgi:hypothetical protein
MNMQLHSVPADVELAETLSFDCLLMRHDNHREPRVLTFFLRLYYSSVGITVIAVINFILTLSVVLVYGLLAVVPVALLVDKYCDRLCTKLLTIGLIKNGNAYVQAGCMSSSNQIASI